LLILGKLALVGFGLEEKRARPRGEQHEIENAWKNAEGFHQLSGFRRALATIGYMPSQTIWANYPEVFDSRAV
jgi:hypothetical protein